MDNFLIAGLLRQMTTQQLIDLQATAVAAYGEMATVISLSSEGASSGAQITATPKDVIIACERALALRDVDASATTSRARQVFMPMDFSGR